MKRTQKNTKSHVEGISQLERNERLISACMNGKFYKALELIDFADINFSSENGSPLTAASYSGNVTLVRKLIQRGAEVNSITKVGTPLIVASRCGHIQVVQQLIDYGAGVNIVTNHGSALTNACANGHIYVVRKLINFGADVNLTTNNGTALTMACGRGHITIIRDLLKRGANISLQTNIGDALTVACSGGRVPVVKELIKSGAKVNQVTEMGRPIDIAIEYCHSMVVKELVRSGAHVTADMITASEERLHNEEFYWNKAELYKIIEVFKTMKSEDTLKRMEMEAEENAIQFYKDNLQDELEVNISSGIKYTKQEELIMVEAVENGTEKDFSIRIHNVGHQGAGKTSLMKQLLLEKFNPKDIKSTEGIEVSLGTCCVDIATGLWHRHMKQGKETEMRLDRLKSIIISRNQSNETTKEHKTKKTAKIKFKFPWLLKRRDEAHATNIEQTAMSSANAMPSVSTMAASTSPEIDEDFSELLAKVCQLDSGRVQNQASVRGYDCAGQSIFYNLHQLFLSKRGVNIIVVDASRNFSDVIEDDDFKHIGKRISNDSLGFFKFWSKSLQYFLQNWQEPRIITVFTHVDLVTHEVDLENKKDCIHQIIKQMNVEDLFLRKIFCINCNDPNDSELIDLRRTIFEFSIREKYWGKRMPSRWILLEDKLMRKKSEGVRVMTLAEVQTLNSESTIALESEQEIILFLKVHHKIGTLMYYADVSLKQMVILDVQWFIDSLKAIITAKCFRPMEHSQNWRLLHEHGIINKEFMVSVWKSKQGERFFEFKNQLILLMLRLDLISSPKLYTENGKETIASYYVVPCMLSLSPLSFLDGYRAGATSKGHPLIFEFINDFLPSATVSRLLAACVMQYGDKFDSQFTIFCDAAVFKINDSHYMILEFTSSAIVVCVLTYGEIPNDAGVGQGVREFLFDTLRCIEKSQNVSAKFCVMLSCGIGCNYEDYGKIKWEDLIHSTDIECMQHRFRQSHRVLPLPILKHWLVIPKAAHFVYNSEGQGEGNASEQNLSHRLIGRISRNIYRKDYILIFQELGMDPAVIDRIEMAYDKKVTVLRLLLEWFRSSQNPTYDSLMEVLEKYIPNISQVRGNAYDWKEGVNSRKLDQKLSDSTDFEIHKIVHNVGARYLELGLELGFQEEEIDAIIDDHRRCHAITKQLLDNWKAKYGPEATWSNLGNAMYEIRAGIGFIQDMFAT